MKMKVSFVLVLLILLSGCGGELECTYGRECDGNISRTCVDGKWVEVECKDNAPICDEKYGCMKANYECGNGFIEGDEECDGAVLNGRTCSDVNPQLAGDISCTAECKYDFSKCETVECQNCEKRCVGDVYQMCSGNAWTDAMDCASLGVKCDPSTGMCISN